MGGFSVDVIIWTVLSLSIQYSVSHACKSSDDCGAGTWCDVVLEVCEQCSARLCGEEECERRCPVISTSTEGSVDLPPTAGPPGDRLLLLLLCILVISCLLVVAAGLTAFVVYRCACARRDRSAQNRDAEKPFLRQTSTSTRASESSTTSADVTCCMTSTGSRDVGQSRGGVTINNVYGVTMAANAGKGGTGHVVETDGQKPSFYLQQEPPHVTLSAKTAKA